MAMKRPNKRPGDVAYNVAIPEAVADAMRDLAIKNGRSVRDETLDALERHLAAPPTIRTIREAPELPASEVDPPTTRPKRGRPPKSTAKAADSEGAAPPKPAKRKT